MACLWRAQHPASEYDVSEYSTLDLLLSPLRKQHAIDKWTPKEVSSMARTSALCAGGFRLPLYPFTFSGRLCPAMYLAGEVSVLF